MTHGKRLLSILLAVILTAGVALPALPRVGEALGTSLTAAADATPQPLTQTDDFDLEAEILASKQVEDITSSQRPHNWVEVYDWPTLYNLLQEDKETYIRFAQDINWEQARIGGNIEIPGVGFRADYNPLIVNNKVIDFNGHMLNLWDPHNDWYITLFYVIKPTTTVILLDSSPEQTGGIWYYADIEDSSYVYTSTTVRDLFLIQDATVYVLGGTFRAGRLKEQDKYTGWEKFCGIASAVVSSAIQVGAQALDIYTSITSGGALGSTGVLSGVMDKLGFDSNDAMGVLTNMVSKKENDGGQTAAKDAKITNPILGQPNVEPEIDDLNGKTQNLQNGMSSAAKQTEKTKGTADVAAAAGSAPSITMNSLGIYTYQGTDGYIFSDHSATTGNIINKDNKLKKGDEVDVLKTETHGSTEWYVIKYKDQEAWVPAKDFKKTSEIGQLTQSTANVLQKGLKASEQNTKDSKLEEFNKKYLGGKASGIGNMVTQTASVVESAVKGIVNAVTEYTSSWYQVHWGTCFKLRGEARLIILDGTFAGHGMGVKDRSQEGWETGKYDIRDEVIDCSIGGEVWVFGGEFYGLCGADIFNCGDLDNAANRGKVHVRGGHFSCSSVNRIRGLQKDGESKSRCVAGTKGSVNLPVEAYGKDLIRDGRIKICESSGVGNLVVKNRSVDENKITYSLYCAESDLRYLSEITVSPGATEYMENSFYLQGHPSQDHVLEGNEYINFSIGETKSEHAYVAAKVNAANINQLIASYKENDPASEKAIEDAIYNTEAWYYKFPQTDFLRKLRVDDIQKGATKGQSYKYISDLRVYTYTLYELDPVTLEEIGEPLAVKNVPSSKVFTGQLYLIPVNYSNGNDFYLYDGWKAGGMYRVTMAVNEVIDVGSPDKTKRDEFGESRRIATIGKTSLIIRCWDKNDEAYTPIRFADEDIGAGDTAQVNFLNARVGRVDLYGDKLFSVQYNWRLTGKDNSGNTFDIPLVTAERKEQGVATPYKIEGHIYDDWEYMNNYGRDYLTSVVNGFCKSTKPYWGGSDSVVIPRTVTVNGQTVSTAGKELYCRVTYGLCYYRWAAALKTLPIIEFPPVADPQHLADNAGSDVRKTAAECTYESKKIMIVGDPSDPKLIKRVNIDFTLPVGDTRNTPAPTTTTPGVKSIEVQYIMFKKVMDYATAGETVVISFLLEAEDGYRFAADYTPWLNDGEKYTQLTRITGGTTETSVKCMLYDGYTIPYPPEGYPLDRIDDAFNVPQPVAGAAQSKEVEQNITSSGGGAKEKFTTGRVASINDVTWSPAADTFKPGEEYTLTFSIPLPGNRLNHYYYTEETVVKVRYGDPAQVYAAVVTPSEDGKTAKVSYTFPALSKDAPVPPAAIIAAASDKEVVITWTAVQDAANYNLYRLKDGNYEKLTTVSGTTYTDKDVTAGTTYSYKVTAVKTLDGKETESPMSAQTAAKVKEQPVAEEKITDQATGVSVTIDKNEYEDAVELKINKLNETVPSIPDTGADVITYDISLVQDGHEIQPKTTVTVRMPIPTGYNKDALKLCRILDNEKVEETPFRVDGDDIVFDVSSCSKYVLVDTSATGDDKPDNPDDPGETVMLGDVNGDGQIKALDARLALRAAVGLENYAPGSREFLAADVNKDGKILAKDARTILRGVVGLEDPKAW